MQPIHVLLILPIIGILGCWVMVAMWFYRQVTRKR